MDLVWNHGTVVLLLQLTSLDRQANERLRLVVYAHDRKWEWTRA
jgi:hypothetical protein